MQEDLVEESHHANCNGISAMKVLHFYHAKTLQSAPGNLLLTTVKLVQHKRAAFSSFSGCLLLYSIAARRRHIESNDMQEKNWFCNPDFVFLDTIECNKKVWILEPRFLIFFFFMQLGASNLMPWNAICPMGVVSFCHPFWTYFTKAKRTKTLYMIYTHTCINLYYYYHMSFHFFTFRALLLHWGYFPLDLGIWAWSIGNSTCS